MPSVTERRGRPAPRRSGLAVRLLPGRLLTGRTGATVLRPVATVRRAAPAADARVSRPRRPRPGGRLRRAAQRLLALTAGASRRGARRRPRAR
ncbi:hypothetical protein EES47_05105 [Streptomyces sp. ADI98-12]|nr:hypothetical protein EES47_05105 [Streptomyces sp. ADI98-12]